MTIPPLQGLGKQCSEIFTQKPTEKTVPIFFRIVKDSIVIEQRPSLLLRFWRFITFRSGQYRLANCATKLQTLFTNIALELKDQTSVHNTLLLISATKETIRRYEAKRKALPESVKLLKKSAHNLTKEIFTSLCASTRSEEKKQLYQWAESQFKEDVKPEDTLNHISKVSEQLFASIEEKNPALSIEIQKDIVLSLLEQEEKEALEKQYNELQAAKNWDKSQPVKDLIDKKISHFNEHLNQAKKGIRKRFFAKIVQQKNLCTRSKHVGLSSKFEEFRKQEERACEQPFSIRTFRKTIEKTVTEFEKQIEAEQEKIKDLESKKHPLQKKLVELMRKGDANANRLLETLKLSDDFASMEKRIAEVTESLSLLEKERLSSFIEKSIQELKLRERCHDLEEREPSRAQALIQELNGIQETITFQDTEESITKKVQAFDRNLKRAEKEWYNEIIAKVFSENPEEAKEFVKNNLEEMIAELKTTNTTQNEELNGLFLKVRYREDRPQALLSKHLRKGSFKTVYVVATLLGPKIHKDFPSVYSYAKLFTIKEDREELEKIEQELQDPNISTENRSKAEEEKKEFLEYLASDFQDISKETKISQELPQDTAVPMYTINHQKRPDELKGIVMKWFNHGDLTSYMRQELPKLTDQQQHLTKLQLAQKMCARFATIHKQNVCHLDGKPHQFLVRTKSTGKLGKGDVNVTIRLTDFGSAKQRGTILSSFPQATFIYTAPEHFANRQQQASPSMDCWSLGMGLVDLFYGLSFNKLRGKLNPTMFEDPETCRGDDNHRLWLNGCQETIQGLPQAPEANIIKGLLDPNPDTRWTAEQAEQGFAKLLSNG